METSIPYKVHGYFHGRKSKTVFFYNRTPGLFHMALFIAFCQMGVAAHSASSSEVDNASPTQLPKTEHIAGANYGWNDEINSSRNVGNNISSSNNDNDDSKRNNNKNNDYNNSNNGNNNNNDDGPTNSNNSNTDGENDNDYNNNNEYNEHNENIKTITDKIKSNNDDNNDRGDNDNKHDNMKSNDDDNKNKVNNNISESKNSDDNNNISDGEIIIKHSSKNNESNEISNNTNSSTNTIVNNNNNKDNKICNCYNKTDCVVQTFQMCPNGCPAGLEPSSSELRLCTPTAPSQRKRDSSGEALCHDPSKSASNFTSSFEELDPPSTDSGVSGASWYNFLDGDAQYRETEHQTKLYLLNVNFRFLCVHSKYNRDLIKTWTTWEINLPVHYLLHSLFFQFDHPQSVGNNQPEAYLTINTSTSFGEFAIRIFHAKCKKISDSSNLTLHSGSIAKCGVLFTAASLHVISDSLHISIKGHQIGVSRPVNLTSVHLAGMPVCPPLRWGSGCQRQCSCPCGHFECHPVTGACHQNRLRACPYPALFGPPCDRKCPSRCNMGTIKGCHAITGTCTSCAVVSSAGNYTSTCPLDEVPVVSNSDSSRKELNNSSSWDEIRLKCESETNNVSLAIQGRSESLHDEDDLDISLLIIHTPTPTTDSPSYFDTITDSESRPLLIGTGILVVSVMVVLCLCVMYSCANRRRRLGHKNLAQMLTQRWTDRMSMKTVADFDSEHKKEDLILKLETLKIEVEAESDSSFGGHWV